jgi:hypothetical protein
LGRARYEFGAERQGKNQSDYEIPHRPECSSPPLICQECGGILRQR